MKKLGLSLLFALMLVGLFAAQASANSTPTPPTTQTVVAPNPSNTDASGTKLLNVDASQNRDDFDPINIPGQNPNANKTLDGVNDQTGASASKVIKSDGMRDNKGVTKDHKTHGSYQNNTNSCASCHQTHTAKARQLLFADSTYNTCTACHDGTLGFYNVFKTGANYTSATNESTGGTFGGSHDGNMSVHLANGAVKIAAAPGGSKSTSDTQSWGATFTCASCHAPHGSYSERLLHYNPANMGNLPVEKGGQQATLNIVEYANRLDGVTASSAKIIAVRGTKENHGLTTGYESITTGATVVMLYELKTSGQGAGLTATYEKSTNPWLYGYSSTSNGRNYQTRLFATEASAIGNLLNADGTIKGYNNPSTNTQAQSNTYNWTNPIVDQNDYQNHQQPNNPVAFKYNKGLVYAENADGETLLNSMQSIIAGRAYVVKLNLVASSVPALAAQGVTKHDVSSLWGTSVTTSNTAGGVQVSTWCTTCHTDYLFSSSWNGAVSKNGNYEGTKYYGHSTNSGSYTCLRCHFAHGTDVSVMVDGESNTVQDLITKNSWTTEVATDYMLDRNPSSALKKFTNLSGCWACHNSSKAASLKNTNRDEQHPDGMVSDLSSRQ